MFRTFDYTTRPLHKLKGLLTLLVLVLLLVCLPVRLAAVIYCLIV